MAAINEITGDAIQTKTNSDAYRNNYDLIFGRKKDSTKEITSGVHDAESCDKSVPEISQDSTLGVTPSH